MNKSLKLETSNGFNSIVIARAGDGVAVTIRGGTYAKDCSLNAELFFQADFSEFVSGLLTFLQDVEEALFGRTETLPSFDQFGGFVIVPSTRHLLDSGPGKAAFDAYIGTESNFSVHARLVLDVTVIDNFREDYERKLRLN